jgi:hypothetical protein
MVVQALWPGATVGKCKPVVDKIERKLQETGPRLRPLVHAVGFRQHLRQFEG